MKIAVFSKNLAEEDRKFILYIADFLQNKGHSLIIGSFLSSLLPHLPVFNSQADLKATDSVDFLLSIGGDGTFLDAASIVGNSHIPIVGINTGRIGFLTNINKSGFENAVEMLENNDFQIEERALLHIDVEGMKDLPCTFALNDVALHSSKTSGLSTIHVWIDGQKINTYWADGLIVATPTGSTAYSLSCGGPIILPSTDVNVITPIASHSLSVRPIIVPAGQEIRLRVEGRCESFLLAFDSHHIALPNPSNLTISRESFTIKTVRFNTMDFFSVIREKLMWGLDRRNNEE